VIFAVEKMTLELNKNWDLKLKSNLCDLDAQTQTNDVIKQNSIRLDFCVYFRFKFQ
jgi:hypothetical protein